MTQPPREHWLMTAVDGAMRQARQLRDLTRSLRSQAQDTRADTRMLAAATAAPEDQSAAAIGRPAELEPRRGGQLRGMREPARGQAARNRRRLAHHPGGGTCGDCQGYAPAAGQPAPGPDRTPAAAAVPTTPDHPGDLAIIGERDRIAARLQDTIMRRVFAAGLSLESAAGLSRDPEVRRRIEAAVGELDGVIREIRTAVCRDMSQPHGRRPSRGIRDLSGQLATTARVSFSGPAGAVPAGHSRSHGPVEPGGPRGAGLVS